jgi:hypothetical protein
MLEQESFVLERGRDSFTLLELIRRAAAEKGLRLAKNAPRALSEPFTSYELDEKLLALLVARNITQQPRLDGRVDIFTLADGGWPEAFLHPALGNYWSFKRKERDNPSSDFDCHVFLSVGFNASIEERGIGCWPRANSLIKSGTNSRSDFNMFRTLVESGGEVPAVAREIAASDGHLVVTWTELGLGGIRPVRILFQEFARGNPALDILAREGKVFDPMPVSYSGNPCDELFIAEPVQPSVFAAWRQQLEKYRESLVM